MRLPQRYVYSYFVAYALSVVDAVEYNDPVAYKDIVSSNDSEKWLFAMNEEMKSLQKNQTLELVKSLKGKKIMGCKWIFKKNEGKLGVEDARYKTRLVAKGFNQVEEIDFNDMFSPVVKHNSVRVLRGLVAMHDLELV